MSKVKQLKDVITDMQALANSLTTLAVALADDQANPASATVEAPELRLSEIRAVLAKKSQDGFTKDIRALLLKHGAARLSEIKPEHYNALLKDVEELS